MKALDTNVIIRYLVQDDPAQSALATDYIEKKCSSESPCFIGQITLCEIAWVLESNYEQDRKSIAHVIEHLLQVAQLEVMESHIVWKALADFKASNADFADHLIARVNESRGCESTVTLDKKAAKQVGFELIK